MKKTMIGLCGVLFILGIVGCSQTKETPSVDGEKLIRELWLNIKNNNWDVLENKIAYVFQSIHEDGTRDRDEEIELLKGLNLGEYTLDNFKTTQNKNVVIVSYIVSVHEMIDGTVLPTAFAQRLSVFQKSDNDWKWIAHANLNPMNK
ncbi:MAG: DUF4440 domain-containing protein [Candidatus Cloacimonetes bacterium]|nr:DUF4440 domain-containing protein [Candidatus Cloacimonadota bacterium]